MAITLTAGASTIELPRDLIWADEFDWSAVAATHRRTLTGALISEYGQRLGGRPITLRGDVSSAWIDRGSLKDLLALSNSLVDIQMSLEINGDTHAVEFNRGSDRCIEAQPIVEFSDPDDGDFYALTLRFTTLAT